MQCPKCSGVGEIPESRVIALCHIEHDGVGYDYGDPVPDAVVQAHPEAVGAKPLTEEDIASMSPEEMADHLRVLAGLKQPPTAGILHRIQVEGTTLPTGESAGQHG